MQPAAWVQIQNSRRIIKERMKACTLCPHACGVDRIAGDIGFCGVDEKLYCFREMINKTEEAGLSPSHQVYFAGCNLRCGFCSVAEWNETPMAVPVIDAGELPERIGLGQKQGAINVNLLGGEPAVSVYGILGVLEKIPVETTVVWNSNMYFSEPVRAAIDGLVDVYLADYKCSGADCCERLLGVRDYEDVVRANLLWATGRAEVLIRHVVLPGHFECCGQPILEWIARCVPTATVSLKADYIPPIPAGHCPEGYLGAAERENILKTAKRLDLRVV